MAPCTGHAKQRGNRRQPSPLLLDIQYRSIVALLLGRLAVRDKGRPLASTQIGHARKTAGIEVDDILEIRRRVLRAKRAVPLDCHIATWARYPEPCPRDQRLHIQRIVLAEPQRFVVTQTMLVQKRSSHQRLQEPPFPPRMPWPGNVGRHEGFEVERDAVARRFNGRQRAALARQLLGHDDDVVREQVPFTDLGIEKSSYAAGEEVVVGIEKANVGLTGKPRTRRCVPLPARRSSAK